MKKDSTVERIAHIFLNLEKKYKDTIVIVYISIACFLFSLYDLSIKLLYTVPPAQILYTSNFLSLILVLTIAHFSNISLNTENPKNFRLLVGRSIFGVLALGTTIISFKILPMTEGMVIASTSPIWAPIICFFIFKERIIVLHVVLALISFVGIAFISQPTVLFGENQMGNQNNVYVQNEWRMMGYFVSLACSIFKIFVGICIRKLPKNFPPFVIVFYFVLVNSIFGGFLMINSGFKALDLFEICICIFNSIIFVFSQILYSRCFQLEKVGKVMILTYIQLILDYFYDVIFLNTEINGYSLIGCLIIIISLLIFVLIREEK